MLLSLLLFSEETETHLSCPTHEGEDVCLFKNILMLPSF